MAERSQVPMELRAPRVAAGTPEDREARHQREKDRQRGRKVAGTKCILV